jgi:hypothetical protein
MISQSSEAVLATLRQLTTKLDSLTAQLVEFAEQLRAAKDVSATAVTETLETANRCAGAIRAGLAGIIAPENLVWENRGQLDELILRASELLRTRDIEQRRTALYSLAADLERGGIIHRRIDRKQALEALRDAAVAELKEKAGAIDPKALPGTGSEHWLEWAWSLTDADNRSELETLASEFPNLDRFVANCEPTMWHRHSKGPDASGEREASAADKRDAQPEPPTASGAGPSAPLPDGNASSPQTSSAAAESPVGQVLGQAQESEAAKKSRKKRATIAERVLPPTVVAHFIGLFQDGKKNGTSTQALAVGTQWPAPVLHGNVGISESLSIPLENCYMAGDSKLDWNASHIAVFEATWPLADVGLELRPRSLPPPLYVGGTDLIRWALRRRQEGADVEVAGVGRMDAADLKWWFEQIRELELPGQAAIDQMYELTGGIPILVGLMDRLLLEASSGGRSLSESQLEAVFHTFTGLAGAEAKQLKGGPERLSLTGREIEVLRMACHVGDTNNLLKDLTDMWDRHRADCPGNPPALNDTDWLSVAVLEHLGLLPCDRSRLRDPMQALSPVKEGDVLRLLVKNLG